MLAVMNKEFKIYFKAVTDNLIILVCIIVKPSTATAKPKVSI